MTEKTLTPMQQELLNRADAIMTSIGGAINRGAEFVQGQVPDIALQYVAFGRVYETVIMAISIMVFMVGLWLVVNVACRNTYKFNSEYGNWHVNRFVCLLLGLFPLSFGLMEISANLKSLILVWFAPKVWLLIEISKLIR